MGWQVLHNAEQDQPRAYYVAYGIGNPGEGERLHHHTVAQTFTCIAGRLQVTVDGFVWTLTPGQSIWAEPNQEHGLLVLEPGTKYLSVFYEKDRPTIDWERIKREQTPSLTPAEIAERASHLT